jgi:extracellular elastinolytic metalloproteinase
VLTNQCTGGPDFRGEQDKDPRTVTDCAATVQADDVRAAELQVFER